MLLTSGVIKLADMNEGTILKDYKLLEKADNLADRSNREWLQNVADLEQITADQAHEKKRAGRRKNKVLLE